MTKEEVENFNECPEEEQGEKQQVEYMSAREETVDEPSTSGSSQVPSGQSMADLGQTANEQLDWNKVIENLEDVTNLISEYFEQSRENKQVENERKLRYFKHQRRIIFIAAGTFIIVIGISALMTFYSALSGDAFTFVLGTLFGAILTFLQNMIGKNENED